MPLSKKVYQYTLEGKYIAEFESINYAAKKTNCNFSGIRGCAAGRYSHSGGYVWRYFKKQWITPEFKNKYETMRQRFKSVTATRGKRIIEFESISEAANFIGCHRSAISQAISEKYGLNSVKGWRLSADCIIAAGENGEKWNI